MKRNDVKTFECFGKFFEITPNDISKFRGKLVACQVDRIDSRGQVGVSRVEGSALIYGDTLEGLKLNVAFNVGIAYALGEVTRSFRDIPHLNRVV